MQAELDQRRDYFPATLIAQKANQGKQQHEVMITAADVLSAKYTMNKESVMITDPDRGAAGGESLKASLKDTTRKAAKKRAKLKAAEVNSGR